MRRIRAAMGAALAAVLVAALAACSGSPPPFHPPPNARTTPGPSSPTATPVAGPTDQASAAAVLLTADEVGRGFTQGPYTAPTGAPPCSPRGSPPLQAQAPPAIDVGRSFSLAQPYAVVDELLDVYPSVATADRAVGLAQHGLSCPTGTNYASDGTAAKVAIGAGADYRDQLQGKADAAYVWRVVSDQLQGTIAVVRLGNDVLTLGLFIGFETTTKGLPSGQTILNRAVSKVHASR